MTKFALGSLSLFIATTLSAQVVDYGGTCPILDNYFKPVYEAGFAVVPDSDFEDNGDAMQIELDADWEFAYFTDVLKGEIDLGLILDTTFFSDATDLVLPDQVLVLALDAGGAWRYVNDWALQVRLNPGIYSEVDELSGDALYFPFKVAVVKQLQPGFSAIAGAGVRPGFDREIMPVLGVSAVMTEAFRIDLQVPESRIVYHVDRDWTSQLAVRWESITYALDDPSEADREAVTLEDIRASAGIMHRLSDEVQLAFEVGGAFAREVSYEKRPRKKAVKSADIDDSIFARIALVGPF